MTDNTLALNVHVPEGSEVSIALDQATMTMLCVHHSPDVAKMVAIPDALGRSFAHMALHQRDLIRARAFLDEIEQQGGVPSGHMPNTACMALWHAALVSAIKCFQSSKSREMLKASDVFGDKGRPVRIAFDLLKAMRNKQVSHDENDWMTPSTYAAIRKPGKEPLIGTIDCLVVEGMDTASIGELSTVINVALAWVNAELDRLRGVIRTDLLTRSYDELMTLPVPQFNTPYRDSVPRRRPR
jgi:hypothetical protein